MADFIVPKPQTPAAQAQLILKGAGLALVKPKFFNIDTAKAQDETFAIEQAKIDYSKTLFGTPIFDVLKFDSASYIDDSGTTINLGGLDLEIALFDINMPRNIVSTKVNGRNGKVFEYMSNDDYQVNIKGCLVSDNNGGSPEKLIRDLNQYAIAPISLKVQSTILSYFGIFTIVIVTPKFTQREGMRNVWDYELQCESETPFEIKSANSNNRKSVPSF